MEESRAAIERTVELGPRLHVDIDAQGAVVGVEVLYPRTYGLNLGLVEERYGLRIEIPLRFAAWAYTPAPWNPLTTKSCQASPADSRVAALPLPFLAGSRLSK